jgi:pyruvate,orthophosphate dikinase
VMGGGTQPPEGLHFIGGGWVHAAPLAPAVIGAKAHGLMRLDALGLPVPPGFVLGTEICRECLVSGALSPRARELLAAGVRHIENVTGKTLGGGRRPLLVSVRSGAPVSMPGMMDTVLDVGLGSESVRGLVRATGNARLAWDSYRRLVHSYAMSVEGMPSEPFDRILHDRLAADGATSVRDLDAEALRATARASLQVFAERARRPMPEDPVVQLRESVEAVFRSWNAPRAVSYRALRGIDPGTGTAAIVQAMVFGNAGPTSGAGVGFTRDPSTGANEPYLDFLFDAQGEDIVSGREAGRDTSRLPRVLPRVAAELDRVRQALERAFRDVQEFEFTVEDGTLFLLQTRRAKRTPWAAVHMAVDLLREGIVDVEGARALLGGIDVERVQRIRLLGGPSDEVLATATPAGIGVAVGRAALDPQTARSMAANGEPVVLVRPEISTSDLPGLTVVAGILTASGGRTSHAAVVARELGKACLVDCGTLRIDEPGRRCLFGTRAVAEGDFLSLDGESGIVYAGRIPIVREQPDAAIAEIRRWLVPPPAAPSA